ncbi:hypothetical protein ACWDR9_39085, partial [Streptosporangium sandarakinum]
MQTTAGRLARLGFADGARAERLLGELGPEAAGDLDLLDALVGTADPDLALTSLTRLVERDPGGPGDSGGLGYPSGSGDPSGSAAPGLLGALRADPGLRARLLGVLGVSAALGDHLVRHPEHVALLAGERAVRRPASRDLRAGLL